MHIQQPAERRIRQSSHHLPSFCPQQCVRETEAAPQEERQSLEHISYMATERQSEEPWAKVCTMKRKHLSTQRRCDCGCMLDFREELRAKGRFVGLYSSIFDFDLRLCFVLCCCCSLLMLVLWSVKSLNSAKFAWILKLLSLNLNRVRRAYYFDAALI